MKIIEANLEDVDLTEAKIQVDFSEVKFVWQRSMQSKSIPRPISKQ